MRALLLCLLAVSAHGAEDRLVATSSDGATVTLTTEAGPCVNGARLAIWRSPDARSEIPGCWVLRADHGLVLVSFLDGERGNIPVGHLRPVASL